QDLFGALVPALAADEETSNTDPANALCLEVAYTFLQAHRFSHAEGDFHRVVAAQWCEHSFHLTVPGWATAVRHDQESEIAFWLAPARLRDCREGGQHETSGAE